MANNNDVAIRRFEQAIGKGMQTVIQEIRGVQNAIRAAQESSRKPDYAGTYFRVAIVVAIICAVYPMVGGVGMTLPFILFGIATLIGIYEWHVQRRNRGWTKTVSASWLVTFLLVMGGLVYVANNVFAVDMYVRFASISKDDHFPQPGGGSSVRLAVKLTNRGKATSLTEWRAYITMPDGTRVDGQLRELAGDSVPIQARNATAPTYYALPECDLGIETAKAMENGDSIYGITDFGFPVSSTRNWNQVKITLLATDVLGRTISNTLTFGDTNPHNFPCPKKAVDHY